MFLFGGIDVFFGLGGGFVGYFSSDVFSVFLCFWVVL